MSYRLFWLLVMPASLLHAQTPAPSGAAAVVTSQEIDRHLRVLAADSFQGRHTPGPALERTARYVAAQFAEFGLVPFGDRVRKVDSVGQNYTLPTGEWAEDTMWLQRYPIPGQQRIDSAESRLRLWTTLNRGGKPIVIPEDWRGVKDKEIRADFRATARVAAEVMPRIGLERRSWDGRRHAILLAGRHTRASAERANLHGEILLYVVPFDADTAEQRQVLAQLATDNDLIVVWDDDSTAFARRRTATSVHPPEIVDDYMSKAAAARTWAVEVRADVAQPVLAAAGVEWAAVRTQITPTVRPLLFTHATLDVRVAPPANAAPRPVTAPNVVGFLRGTGEESRGYQNLYVVISAPMDEADGGDAENGEGGAARTSGLAGLLALAKAFSQPGARPRYSLLFVATSGSAGGSGPGLWGSRFLLRNNRAELAVAHLGLDGLGQVPGDSVWIDGLHDIELAVSPLWTIGLHPELGLAVAPDDGTGERLADHLAFVQGGVPSLSIRGTPIGSAQGSGVGATAVDTDYAARVVRAALYLGWSIADAERPPRLTPAGRRRFLPGTGP